MTTGDPRKAAGLILAEGINVAAGIATAKIINKSSIPNPAKAVITVVAGTAVSISADSSTISIVERLTEAKKQSEKIKSSMSLLEKRKLDKNALELTPMNEDINLLKGK